MDEGGSYACVKECLNAAELCLLYAVRGTISPFAPDTFAFRLSFHPAAAAVLLATLHVVAQLEGGSVRFHLSSVLTVPNVGKLGACYENR